MRESNLDLDDDVDPRYTWNHPTDWILAIGLVAAIIFVLFFLN